MDALLNHEIWLRLSFFFGIFATVALWAWLAPRRTLRLPKYAHWRANLGIIALNPLTLRLFFPTAAIGLALMGQAHGWGLLNNWDIPPTLALIMGVILLDLAIYTQHVMFHTIPILWRLHRMHHADLDYDVTTGARFHPIEMLLSMGIKLAVIAALGPSAVAVLIFEVLLNATAMFNHGNIHLPIPLDRLLRWLVVTPDMHRAHQAVQAPLANSNFGVNLPWWDRLMGTYLAQPPEGHQQMPIGLETFRNPQITNTLPDMLRLPFIHKIGAYPLNRR
ncbi:sterol desaturase family protein [Magnetococcus sp. PR-3]|uniref:sterol desaturase family protein n=1 Tax=Magnetococcus sp. PR-3 TaxID=3120355 RepID=UPI002FCE1674